MMDIGQIEAFMAIARLGSFSKAAAKLHRSQPAISRRVALLEAELGVVLFERIQRRVELTDSGRAFQPHAEAMLAATRSGTAAVHAQREGGAGTVSLAIVGTLINDNLAKLVAKFSTESPASLVVTTGSSELISGMIRSGDAVVGLRYFLDRSPEVHCEHIGWETMVVVARGGRKRRHMSTNDFATRWIGFTRSKVHNEAFGALLQSQLQMAGVKEPEIMLVDSLSAQKRLVEAGVGLGYLPASSVERELAEGTLVKVNAPKISTRIPIAIVHRRNGYLSPLALEVLHALRTQWK